MNYYYDTEFLEGTQKGFFKKPTIDLISIGIVSEDNREYYAISKDFNLKEAWNRYDIKNELVSGDMRNKFPDGIKRKVYWIRENVLRPIFYELYGKDINFHNIDNYFTYKEFKKFINKYGKSNKQIAKEVELFCKPFEGTPILWHKSGYEIVNIGRDNTYVSPTFGTDFTGSRTPPVFYGYYSAYDHVALCWLFGKMINLPNGFPMYTVDLKQMLDEKVSEVEFKKYTSDTEFTIHKGSENLQQYLDLVKGEGLVNGTYPKQENEHNALSDAMWNRQLHNFINGLCKK